MILKLGKFSQIKDIQKSGTRNIQYFPSFSLSPKCNDYDDFLLSWVSFAYLKLLEITYS
jgi:hypothetical protein